MSARPKTIVCDYPECSQHAEEDNRPGWGRQDVVSSRGWYKVYDFCPDHNPLHLAFWAALPAYDDARRTAGRAHEKRHQEERNAVLTELDDRYGKEWKAWEKDNPPPHAPWLK